MATFILASNRMSDIIDSSHCSYCTRKVGLTAFDRKGWLCKDTAHSGAYGVVVGMFDFHRSDRGSNPGCGGKIS